jgi:cytochrome c-type biogenesis protein
MEFGIASFALAVGAGVASVASPCVLPVVPVIVAGADREDRARPLLIVLGLSATFITMGLVTTLMGSMLVGRMRSIEIAGGALIAAMGLLHMLEINPFKRLYRLQNIQVRGEGRTGAVVMGMALGVIWIPCIGPVLSGILAMVGTGGKLAEGVVLLGLYSLGFSLPMLALGYFSHALQRYIHSLYRHEKAVRYVTGGALVLFGLYIVALGNFAF